MILHYMLYAVVAFFLSWMSIPLCRYIGKRYHFVAEPDKRLPAYRKNLSYLGGGAIYLAFIITLLIFFMFQPKLHLHGQKLVAILIGAALITIIHWVGDVYRLSGWIKGLAQLISAVLLILAGIRTGIYFLDIFPVEIGGNIIYIGNAVLSLLWILAVINLINALEILDGILISYTLLVSFFLFVIAILGQNQQSAFLILLFAGPLVGMLWELLPPPQHSLGQMGSSFIGFMMAALSLEIDYSRNNPLGVLIPLLLLSIPASVVLASLWRKVTGNTKKLDPRPLVRLVSKRSQKQHLMAVVISTSVTGFACVAVFLLSAWIVALPILIVGIGPAVWLTTKLKGYPVSDAKQ